MSQYSRRTVVRGAAWSIPVVAVAANAPAFAASTDVPSIATAGAVRACKTAGGVNCQGYLFNVTFSVQPSDSWEITFLQVVKNGESVTAATSPRTFTVSSAAPGVSFVMCTSDSASQFDLTLVYSARNLRTGASSTVTFVTNLSGVRNC